MAAVTKSRCAFLELPPEMRNRIYCEVFSKPPYNAYYPVRAWGYGRPGLVSTCRQIRQESLAMFYAETKFGFASKDYSCPELHRFMREIEGLSLRGVAVNTSLDEYPNIPDWDNLMEWLRLYHAREVRLGCHGPSSIDDESDMEQAVVGGLFLQMRELWNMCWRQAKRVVEVQRPTLIKLNKGWVAPVAVKEEAQ